MRIINRTCIVCGHKYSYCPSCAEDSNKPTWMTIFHDENCKNIFKATSDYLQNAMSKEDAKDILDKCDLSNKNSMHRTVIEAIDEIYADTHKEESEIKIQKRKYEKKTTN